MASQTFTVATIGGESASSVRSLFAAWVKTTPKDSDDANPAVDNFCLELRARRTQLPTVYYCEWIDRWLCTYDVSKSGWVFGSQFEACCMSPNRAIRRVAYAKQNQEQTWLSSRLKEAGKAWRPLVQDAVIVVTREVFDGSTLDEEILATLGKVPKWLETPIRGSNALRSECVKRRVGSEARRLQPMARR